MVVPKILILPNQEADHELEFFQELFQKWGFEAHIIKNSEQALIKYNIVKPQFVVLSTDLDIDYQHFLDFFYFKKCALILYGKRKLPIQLTNNELVKAMFSIPIEMDLYQLKNILSGKDVSLNTMLSQSVSHTEMVIDDYVLILELEGNIQFEDIHHLKYHLIHLFEENQAKSILFIFQYLEGSEANLISLIRHLLSFRTLVDVDSNRIKYMAGEISLQKILSGIKDWPPIEKVESYTEAYFKILGFEGDIKNLGQDINDIGEQEILAENLYTITGKLLKKKGDHFSNHEKEDLAKHGIKKAYPAGDLTLLGKIAVDEYFIKGAAKEFVSVPEKTTKTSTNQQNRKKILLIDDDNNILNILANVLETLNFNSITASTGVEGFEIASEHTLDLIIVDLMMPGFNGIDFIRTFRETNSKKIPIMVISAINKKEIIAPLVKMGIEDYLLKPLNIQEFAKKILKVIG